MTSSELLAVRSSSPTALLVAESGVFTSTGIMVSDCKDAGGIFVFGGTAVISHPAVQPADHPLLGHLR